MESQDLMAVSQALPSPILRGLVVGFSLASLVLGGIAVKHARFHCVRQSAEECAYEQRLAHDAALLHGYDAAGCLLIAAGLLVWTRSRKTA